MSGGAFKDIDTAIGGRIRSLRTAAKLTADQVAHSASMSLEDYEAGERGERRFNGLELYYIAQRLRVELKDIVSVL
jgi:transcriptional regulator with XRE-family HTH domain